MPVSQISINSMRLSDIRPPSYRLRENLGEIEELKASMREKGLLQPIVVRRSLKGSYYEVVAGHRRYIAAIELGWKEISVSVAQLSDEDAFLVALTENIQRKTMEPIEEALAFHRYVLDYGWGSESELAKKIGKGQAYISQSISLLKLPKEIITRVKSEPDELQYTRSHGEVLAHVQDNEKMSELADLVTELGLSVEQTRLAKNYVNAGWVVRDAVKRVLEHPELPVPESIHQYDPIEDAREIISRTIDKTLAGIDEALNSLPDGEEKRQWIQKVRLPVHDLKDSIVRLRKTYHASRGRWSR